MSFSIRRGLARALAVHEGFGRRLFMAGALLLILSAAVEYATQEQRIERRFSALPLTFTLMTDEVLSRGEVLRNFEPNFVTPGGPSAEFLEHNLLEHDRWSWQFTDLTKRIEIDIGPEFKQHLSELRIAVNGREVPVTLSEPEAVAKNGRTVLRHRVIVPDNARTHSVLAPETGFINWRGDWAVLGRMAAFFGFWGGLLVLIRVAARSRRFVGFWERRVASGDRQTEEARTGNVPPAPGSRLWFWAGLGSVIVTLGALQWRDPFYFTQDDNFSQFLPVILAGGRSFFQGVLFDYNPYQLLGAPTVEVGTYALTYPGTYLAYALARLLGDEALTIEIFCMGHLILGFAAAWWASRRWGAGAAMAAALAVCFVLSGYALVVGRSWYYMTPLFLWLPLALGALYGVFFRERKIRDSVLMGVSLGFLFHAGNAQMWLYAAGATAVLALAIWMREGRPRRPFVHLIAAGLTALAIVMPLFLLQFGFATEAMRDGGGGYTLTPSMTSLLLPLPLDATDMNFRLSPVFLMQLGPLLYSGPLLIPAGLAAAALMAAAVLGRGVRGRFPLWGLFAFAGLAAFLLACGFNGPLWFVHAALPVLEKFTHPIKFLPLALLLLGLAAILFWERLNLPRPVQGRAAAVFALGAFGLMFWNAMRTHELAFHYFADDPYPGMARPVAEPRQHRARLYPMNPVRSTYAGYPESRNLNFAMVYGELSLWGYDPIIWTHPQFQRTLVALVRDPVPLLREFGVNRLIIWHEYAALLPEIHYIDTLKPWQADIAGLIEAGGIPLPDLSDDTRLHTEVQIGKAKPLAYALDDPSLSYPVTVAGPRVEVHFGKAGWTGGDLVLSFLTYPRTVVRADGKQVPHHADKLGRVVARVPKGARRVTLVYAIDWMPGLSVAMALLILAAYGIWRFDGPGRRGRKQS